MTIASDSEILVLVLPEAAAAVADDDVAMVTVTELFDDDTRGADWKKETILFTTQDLYSWLLLLTSSHS